MADFSRAVATKLRDRFFRTKWLVMLIAVAVLMFFGRTAEIPSLTQSALVIGLGIERTEDGFNVSTLSVVVSGGGGGDPSQSYAVYSATGGTISEGLDKISQKMGLLVSLSHCNVLVMSPSAFSGEHSLLFDPLVSSYSLPEQAAVTATELPPSDVLAARIGTTVASTYYVQASLLQNLGGDGIALVTVKDFAAQSLSRSGSVNIPLIDMREMPHQPESQEGASEGNVEFSLNRNLVVCGADTFVLEEDLAQAATMLLRSKVKGKLSVGLPNGATAEFKVLSVRPKMKAKGMSVTAELEAKVSFLEVQNVADISPDPSSPVVREAAEYVARDLEAKLRECHALSLEHNADFLLLQNEVYRKLGCSMPEDCLADIAFDCSVTVSVRSAG